MSAAWASASATRLSGCGRRIHAKANGANSSTPCASPAHQVIAARVRLSASRSPAWSRLAVPTVAAITGVPSAIGKISRNTSRTRPSDGSKSRARSRSQAPASAARVFPDATAAAVSSGSPCSA